MRRRLSRVVLALGAVAIVAITGGVTYAVAQIGGGGVINGCYKSQNGQLRVIDPATDSCNPSETAISWSQTGPQGAKGEKGDEGDPGPQGPAGSARAWAFVNGSGVLGTNRRLNVTSVTRFGAGVYCVRLAPPLVPNQVIAVVTTSGGSANRNYANAAPGGCSTPAGPGVQVATWNGSGGNVDTAFMIAIP
jgi:hypothetical protein